MRRKKTADPLGYGRLLDAWIPPAGAGEALGCFATTFTFHASFFETECLGRMLQLECDPESGAAYLVEREEKMARLMSACVVVDRAHARGQRSLRWDLIPFRTNVGILHAKLSILLWQHHARVIVASANLTENGYRQNLEVFSVFDFPREGRFHAGLFGAAADFADEVLDQCQLQSPAWIRSRAFLALARRRVASWAPLESPPPKLRSALVSVTPRSRSVFAQLVALWPAGSPPESLFVLSPFFDQSPVNLPAAQAWKLLRQRGGASILYSVVAEPIRASERLLVHAPASLAASVVDGGSRAEITFQRIRMAENRALHAKSLWLEGSGHFLHCIGSSNFTSAGLGLSGNRNWELNVASWARLDNRDEFTPRDAAWPDHEPEAIDPEGVKWEPFANLEDELDPQAPLLPNWCGAAVYMLKEGGQAVLQLTFEDSVPEEWAIWDDAGKRMILTADDWRSAGSPREMQLPWPESRPPTELLVRLTGASGDARWPVEVRSFSDLPPPQELRDLTLEQLLHILTSALPLHRCLEKLRRKSSGEPGTTVPAIALDPLRRFARDTHLLERTRRFSLAMAGMRRRLENPIPSAEYLEWRLHGPVGIAKIAAAILKEAGSEGEKAFLLGELALELSQIQPKSEAGCLSRKQVADAIDQLIAEFEKQAEPLLAATERGLHDYVRSALKKARA